MTERTSYHGTARVVSAGFSTGPGAGGQGAGGAGPDRPGESPQEKGRRKLALDAWREAAALWQALGCDQDLAELYERMAGNCLDMGWTDKSCGYYREARDLYRKLGDMPQVGRLYVQIGALERWGIDENKRSFQRARIVFRGLSNRLWEARSFLIQARTYWLRSYWEDALGYLRYGQELLARLPEASGGEDRQTAIDFARRLQVYFREDCRSSEAYQQALEASDQAYEEAKGEEEAVRRGARGVPPGPPPRYRASRSAASRRGEGRGGSRPCSPVDRTLWLQRGRGRLL